MPIDAPIHMLQTTRFSTKLALSFAIILVLNFALGIISIKGLVSSERLTDEMTTETLSAVALLSELRQTLQVARIAYRDALLSSDSIAIGKQHAVLMKVRTRSEIMLDSLRTILLPGETAPGIDSISSSLQRYVTLAEEGLRLAETQRPAEAVDLLDHSAREVSEQALAEFTRLIAQRLSHADELRLQKSSTTQTIFVVIILMVLITFAVSVALSAGLYRVWTRQISEFTDAAGKIANGQLGIRVNLDTNDDEIGHLALSFNKMADNLTGMVEHSVSQERELRESLQSMVDSIQKFTASELTELKMQHSDQQIEQVFQAFSGELRGALEKEKELSQLKQSFIATVSHEFRTPLTGITTSCDLLEHYGDQMEAGRRKTELAKIRSRVQELVFLMNDVLTQSSLSAMKEKFNPGPLSATRLIRLATDDVAPILTAKSQTVSIVIPDHSTEMLADEKLLRLALTNLIVNASKYSQPGSAITISVSSNNNNIKISVSDKGIGIPQAELKNLFIPFQRASNVGTIPGTGLGLSIVKGFVDIHHGSIDVVSNLGVGTTFTISIPALISK